MILLTASEAKIAAQLAKEKSVTDAIEAARLAQLSQQNGVAKSINECARQGRSDDYFGDLSDTTCEFIKGHGYKVERMFTRGEGRINCNGGPMPLFKEKEKWVKVSW